MPQAEAQQQEDQNALQAPPVNRMKLAWGVMKTCTAVLCPGGTVHYTNFQPEATGDEEQAQVPAVQHSMPSMLHEDPSFQPFQYAVLLRDIQATCLCASIPLVHGGPDVPVFMPYRPVGRHG
jgi:hypothetical protein